MPAVKSVKVKITAKYSKNTQNILAFNLYRYFDMNNIMKWYTTVRESTMSWTYEFGSRYLAGDLNTKELYLSSKFSLVLPLNAIKVISIKVLGSYL